MAKRRKLKPLALAPEIEAEILFEPMPGQKVRAKRIDAKRLRLPPSVRHWFTLRTIGGDLDVILGTAANIKDLRGRYGVTDADAGIIALDESSPLLRLVVTLLHELLHGALTAPGDHNLLARLFGCPAEEADAREEEIVTHLAPRLADTLIRSGLLRLPPIPRRRRRA
jgi:hypothetical protein